MQKNLTINAAGCSIRCKLYSGGKKSVNTLVVYGHGFGGSKETKSALRFADRLITKHPDAALLVFDWPCHGQDVRRQITLSDCDTYLEQVLLYLGEHYPHAALYGYATSFGGFLFLRRLAQKGNPFVKLALRCPAVNIHQVLADSAESADEKRKLKAGKPVLLGYEKKIRVTQDFLEDLEASDVRKMDFLPFAEDILILHGTKDRVIDFDLCQSFADEQCIEFIGIENADHGFLDKAAMEQAIKAILDFFEL